MAVLLRNLSKIAVLAGGILAINFYPLIPFGTEPHRLTQKVILIAHILIFVYIVGEVLVYLYDRYSRAKFGPATSLFHILVRKLVYAVGIVILANVINIEIASILTALGVGGLAVALALQDTLSNLFAGLHIFAAKQLMAGDYVKLENGEEGYLIDINWRNTEIRTLLENVIIVPNSKISGVYYDSVLEKVEVITLDTARQLLSQYPPLPKSFEPEIRIYEFAESSINLTGWLATNLYENQYVMKHEFVKRLHKRFKEERIEIPFPIRTVYMRTKDE